MSFLDILRRARSMLAAPGFWRPDHLLQCSPGSIAGTIYSVVPAPGREEAAASVDLVRLLNDLAQDDGYDYLASWENAPGRTQADVLSLMDRAIAVYA